MYMSLPCLKGDNFYEGYARDIMNKTKVLFICTGNSARSQIAEAFLRAFAGERFEAYSAGLEPSQINPLTHKVMEEAGIDISKQYSKSLDEYLGKVVFDHVITVCADADEKCPSAFFATVRKIHWNLEDPAKFTGTEAEKLNNFREVRDLICNRVKEWIRIQTTGA
jgi:arsenate reductase